MGEFTFEHSTYQERSFSKATNFDLFTRMGSVISDFLDYTQPDWRTNLIAINTPFCVYDLLKNHVSSFKGTISTKRSSYQYKLSCVGYRYLAEMFMGIYRDAVYNDDLNEDGAVSTMLHGHYEGILASRGRKTVYSNGEVLERHTHLAKLVNNNLFKDVDSQRLPIRSYFNLCITCGVELDVLLAAIITLVKLHTLKDEMSIVLDPLEEYEVYAHGLDVAIPYLKQDAYVDLDRVQNIVYTGMYRCYELNKVL